MATFVDTNVLLDLVTNDPQFAHWSLAQMEARSLRGPLIINNIIYAELSVRYPAIEALDEFVGGSGLTMQPLPRPALFLAGKVFLEYRKSGGTKEGVLPDFFIGAHAAVSRQPLLTRDTARYKTWFPTVALITP